MQPFDKFTIVDPQTGDPYIAEFVRLKRTPHRAKVWPVTAVSGVRCLIRQLNTDDKECTRCAIGVSYRYKKDPHDLMVGMKYAFKRAIELFEDKDFRTNAWDVFNWVFKGSENGAMRYPR